jgi:hypothetical protein
MSEEDKERMRNGTLRRKNGKIAVVRTVKIGNEIICDTSYQNNQSNNQTTLSSTIQSIIYQSTTTPHNQSDFLRRDDELWFELVCVISAQKALFQRFFAFGRRANHLLAHLPVSLRIVDLFLFFCVFRSFAALRIPRPKLHHIPIELFVSDKTKQNK